MHINLKATGHWLALAYSTSALVKTQEAFIPVQRSYAQWMCERPLIVTPLQRSRNSVTVISTLVITTSVQSSWAKGRITDLSPLAAANGFVPSWLPFNTWFIGSTRVSRLMSSPSVQPFLHNVSVWPTYTQTDLDKQTTLRTCDPSRSNRPHRMHWVQVMRSNNNNHNNDKAESIYNIDFFSNRKYSV